MAATSDPQVLADFPEEPEERAQREVVFKRDTLPWWVGPVGYLVFTVAGCIAIPLLYPPIKVGRSLLLIAHALTGVTSVLLLYV